MSDMLDLKKFEEASEIVKKVTLNTNLIYSDYFSEQTGNQVYIKPENMQFTGAYKVRGAYYKMSTLSEEERQRVQPFKQAPAGIPAVYGGCAACRRAGLRHPMGQEERR